MTDILRDPIWQFIGVALSLVAIAITIFAIKIQYRKKSLAFSILISKYIPLTNSKRIESIKRLAGNLDVRNVYCLAIKIKNNGNIPILQSDFQEPLCFRFANEILAAGEVCKTEVLKTMILCHPIDFETQIDDSILYNRIIINPLLMNPKDSIFFKVLLNGFNGEVNVGGRIMGVSKIKKMLDITGLNVTKYLISSGAGTLIALVASVLFEREYVFQILFGSFGIFWLVVLWRFNELDQIEQWLQSDIFTVLDDIRFESWTYKRCN